MPRTMTAEREAYWRKTVEHLGRAPEQLLAELDAERAECQRFQSALGIIEDDETKQWLGCVGIIVSSGPTPVEAAKNVIACAALMIDSQGKSIARLEPEVERLQSRVEALEGALVRIRVHVQAEDKGATRLGISLALIDAALHPEPAAEEEK